MARSKQSKSQSKVDGKYRQETREERRTRQLEQEEARQKCADSLPYAGGAVMVFLLLFAIYVRSIPPPTPVLPPPKMDASQFQGAGTGTGTAGAVPPEFMVNHLLQTEEEPMVKEALEEGTEGLNEAPADESESHTASEEQDEAAKMADGVVQEEASEL